MPEIMNNRRRKAGSSAIAFFAAHEGDIAAGLEERLSPLLRPGEDPVDFGLALKLLGRLVETGLGDLDLADAGHSDDTPLLEVLLAAREVCSQVGTIRRIFGGLYGLHGAKEILGLAGPTARPSQPDLLIRQGRHLGDRLRDPELEPPRHTASVEFDPAMMAAELDPAVDRLAEAWEAALCERFKRDEVVGAKSEAGRAFDADHRDSLRLGVGLCQMARLPELASRLRASQIKPTRRRS